MRTYGLFCFVFLSLSPLTFAQVSEADLQRAVTRGLDWLATNQSRRGHWDANGSYPSAMTGMAGIALLCEGSTTTQGKYSRNIRDAVDFLIKRSRPNGLIGDQDDDRYTYGHGFGLLFLSQVFGEEEDEARRSELIDVLTRAVKFCGQSQTKPGGSLSRVSYNVMRSFFTTSPKQRSTGNVSLTTLRRNRLPPKNNPGQCHRPTSKNPRQ